MAAAGLSGVRERIAEAERRAGRSDRVTLVAVSKSRSAEEVAAAYETGQRDFGENRADELVAKAGELPDDIRWHFVGALQSRKARLVRPLTHLLHSMDRPSLARRWQAGDGDPPPVLLQVNIGFEPQKSGVAPDAVDQALEQLATEGVVPVGLMAIPPAPRVPEDSRPHFRALARLYRDLREKGHALGELSMGMTDDYEIAVEEGATIVRVGRAIFGPRTD